MKKKEYYSVSIETANVRNLKIAQRYLGCTNISQLIGLLLEKSNLHTPDTIIAGEPARSKFERHTQHQNQELRLLLIEGQRNDK